MKKREKLLRLFGRTGISNLLMRTTSQAMSAMKTPVIFLLFVVILTVGCASQPFAVEIGDVCSQPRGSDVIVRGYISMPDEIEITKFTRGGDNVGMTYKLSLLGEPEESRVSLAVVIKAGKAGEPNRIRVLPASSYSRSDLVIYAADTREFVDGQLVEITGAVADHDKEVCVVNVESIRQP